MNPLSDKQLQLNQIFINLIHEYENETLIVDHDAKSLMKYIWNRGYMLVPKDNSIY